jgi:hypothetical protein
MVAVRMVSEGVDIPRLAVGVYATSVSTALYFAQAVGRFVRARRRGETASVFLPSIPVLLGFAAELEAERDHVLARRKDGDAEERDLAEAQRQRDTPDTFDEPAFRPLQASAHFDRALYDGGEFGTSAEEEDFLGLPGLLAPDQVALLLRKRQAEQAGKRARQAAAPGAPAPGAAAAGWAVPGAAVPGAVVAGAVVPGAAVPGAAVPGAAVPGAGGIVPGPRGPGGTGPAVPAPTARETLAALRKELNGLIAARHHLTGQPHGVTHRQLREACGGPALPEATAAQIRARIDTIRRWAS